MLELHGYPWAEALPQRTNLGFAGGANAGLRRVETSFAVVLNPDVEVAKDFGDNVVQVFAGNEKLGVAGTLMTYPDERTIQHAGGIVIPPLLYTDHRGRGQPLSDAFMSPAAIDYATGGALGLRMDAVRAIGGFDEQFSPAYYEDVDLSTRARNSGWRVELRPELRAVHHEGATLGQSRAHFLHIQRNRIRYAIKHLDGPTWANSFVPAEIYRIRHLLAGLVEGGLPEEIGVEGIEILLREYSSNSVIGEPVLTVPDAPNEELGIDDLQSLRRVFLGDVQPGNPVGGRLKGWFHNWAIRPTLEPAFADQRAFNDAVMRALAAQQERNHRQDQINREQFASLLLVALTVIGGLRQEADRSRLSDFNAPTGCE